MTSKTAIAILFSGLLFLTREELLTQVWGYQSCATRTLDVHVAQLRQKLEREPSAPELLLTVRGQGYRLCTQQLDAM